MNKYVHKNRILVAVLMILSFNTWAADQSELLNQYLRQGATSLSADRGQKLWYGTINGEAPFTKRSCTSCHTKNSKNIGRHIRTNKAIKPMAPSVNPQILNNAKKVEKWFKRNCKWTFGRECTQQEKGDIITYIQTQ